MTDLGISSINTGVVKNLKNVSESIDPKEINIKTEKDKKKSTAAKVVLAGLGAAAAIAVGILAVKKGQGAKTIKEIGADKFKEAGNTFVKGKALTKNGEPFTGVITKLGSDGFKHKIEYVNGVIKEVKTYKTSRPIEGKVYDLPYSKKTYNYNANGKLQSVDKYSFGHVSSLDPKQSGMQYIKTSSINLDENRAEGLKKFAEKQAEIKKQTAINDYIESTRQQLTGKQKINSDAIDNYFNRYETKNPELQRLQEKYKGLEQKEQQIKENVSKLKEKMHTKTDVNAQTIDKQFETNKGLEELNNYYRGLEQKEQQIKENVAKLKEKMHTKPEINAKTIDAQFANNSDELVKLKESLLNPQPYKSNEEKKLIRTVADYINDNVYATRSDIAAKIREAFTLAGQEFKPVNKFVKFANGEVVNIIYEGHSIDITSDGRLLRKVLVTINNDLKKVKYNDITEKIQQNAIKKYEQAESARLATEQRSRQQQAILLSF